MINLGGRLMKKRVLAIIVMGVFILSLIGCSQNKPEQAVSELFDAMKNTDLEKLGAILDSDASEITDQDAFVQLIKKSNETLTYTIGETTIENDRAVVNVSCTYGDMKPVLAKAFANYVGKVMEVAFSGESPSDEEIQEMLLSEITAALDSTPTEEYSTELTVDCVKKDGKWIVDTDKENLKLADVLTGNLVSAFSEMADSMNSSLITE